MHRQDWLPLMANVAFIEERRNHGTSSLFAWSIKVVETVKEIRRYDLLLDLLPVVISVCTTGVDSEAREESSRSLKVAPVGGMQATPLLSSPNSSIGLRLRLGGSGTCTCRNGVHRTPRKVASACNM